MISIKPILYPELLEVFNKGRFEGELEGVIASDGRRCIGYCLYRLDSGTAVVLDAQGDDAGLLDGVLRAALALAQDEGAAGFWVSDGEPALTAWRENACRGRCAPIPFEQIFGRCAGKK